MLDILLGGSLGDATANTELSAPLVKTTYMLESMSFKTIELIFLDVKGRNIFN